MDDLRVCGEVARLSDVFLSTETPPKVAGDGKDLAVRAFLHKGRFGHPFVAFALISLVVGHSAPRSGDE